MPGTPEQIAHGVKDDSPELFLKDTLKAGEYFNDPKLAHALCYEALDAYKYLIANGCKFAKTPFIQGGHSKIRSPAPEVSAGISVLIPLHRKFLSKGGVMLNNTIVDEVIKQYGAAFDPKTGKRCFIMAGSAACAERAKTQAAAAKTNCFSMIWTPIVTSLAQPSGRRCGRRRCRRAPNCRRDA